jgi:hypothetical protein
MEGIKKRMKGKMETFFDIEIWKKGRKKEDMGKKG